MADRPASAWRVVRSPPDGSFAAQLHPPSRRWRSWTAFANDSLFPSCFSDETKRGTTVARRRSDLAGTRARRSQQQPPRPGSVVNAGSWSPRGRGKRRAQMGCGGTGGAAGGKGRQRWRDGAWDKRLRSRRRVAAGERRGPSGATPVGVPSLPAAVRGQAGTPRALCVPACLFWLQGAAVGLTGQRADEREGFAAAATDDAVGALPVSPDANGDASAGARVVGRHGRHSNRPSPHRLGLGFVRAKNSYSRKKDMSRLGVERSETSWNCIQSYVSVEKFHGRIR